MSEDTPPERNNMLTEIVSSRAIEVIKSLRGQGFRLDFQNAKDRAFRWICAARLDDAVVFVDVNGEIDTVYLPFDFDPLEV